MNAIAFANKKPWYKSKTILSCIAAIVLSSYDILRSNLAPELPPIPPALYTLLAGFGIYGRRAASKTIGSVARARRGKENAAVAIGSAMTPRYCQPGRGNKPIARPVGLCHRPRRSQSQDAR